MGSRQANAEMRRWLQVVRRPKLKALQNEWSRLVKALRTPVAEQSAKVGAEQLWFESFLQIYTGDGRSYHNIQHIQNVIAWIHELLLDEPLSKKSTALLAAWFHDLVYETGRRDNEEASVKAMKRAAVDLDIPSRVISKAAGLVLRTKDYRWSKSTITNAFMDADLAILGSPPLVYRQYSRAIRTEYSWVPERQFLIGRKKVLGGFLRRRRIYKTKLGFEMLEETARRNIENELEGIHIPLESNLGQFYWDRIKQESIRNARKHLRELRKQAQELGNG